MRVTTASLVLLSIFAAPAAAHASPVFDSFAPADEETRVTYQSLPNRPAIDEQSILYTPGEHEGLSSSFLGVQPFADDDRSASTYSVQHSAATFSINTIPEPPSLVLLGSGLLFAAGAFWRRLGRTKQRSGPQA